MWNVYFVYSFSSCFVYENDPTNVCTQIDLFKRYHLFEARGPAVHSCRFNNVILKIKINFKQSRYQTTHKLIVSLVLNVTISNKSIFIFSVLFSTDGIHNAGILTGSFGILGTTIHTDTGPLYN